MKDILFSKKSIIVILILLFVLTFIFLSVNCIKPNTSTIELNNSTAIDNSASTNSTVNTFSSSNNVDSYMDRSEDRAINHLRSIIKKRGSSQKEAVILSEKVVNELYFVSPNLNQAELNYNLKKLLGTQEEITNTCTLIAIAMAKNIIDFNSNLRIDYDDGGNEDVRNLLVFKELYEIATSALFNIDYSSNGGTPISDIHAIVRKYYAGHGYFDVSIINEAYTKNVMTNLTNYCVVPTVLTIDNYYYNGYLYNNSAHSVTIKGGIVYEIEYRQFISKYDIVGRKIKKQFCLFVISNGWHNSNDSDFGDTVQILVFEDDASYAHQVSLPGWLDYEK